MQYLASDSNINEIVEVYSIFRDSNGKMAAVITDRNLTFPFKTVKLSKLRPIGIIVPNREAKIPKSRLLHVAKILSDNGIGEEKIPELINEIGKALLHREIVVVNEESSTQNSEETEQ